MRLLVACVGQRMPGWVTDAWNEYARRMPREMSLQLRELPLATRGRKPDIRRVRKQESEALLAAVPSGYRIVALDGRGKAWSTEALAGRMESWMADGRDCSFLVGGPDGIDETCLARTDERWSLGPLTLPHPLVRVLLAEQLYRAWSIVNNHPYHRA
jgi:23S rRNA (pseudouridine1915-N3)-methyltransferase